MAEEEKQEPPVEGAKPAEAPPPADDDVLFRIQIAVSDFITSNIRFVGYAMGLTLLVALVYGGWETWKTRTAADQYAAIARIDYKMPKPNPMAEMGFGPADDPADAGRMKDLEVGAGFYEEIAKGARGSAAVTAWFRAADAWKRAGKPEQQVAALRAAVTAANDDAIGVAAKMSLASTLLEQGQKDEAVGIYQGLTDQRSDFLGQEAGAALIRAQVTLGRMEEARTAYANFKQKFPNANRPELEVLGLGSGS